MSRIDQNDKVVIMPYSYVFNQESFYKQVIDIHLLLQTFFRRMEAPLWNKIVKKKIFDFEPLSDRVRNMHIWKIWCYQPFDLS